MIYIFHGEEEFGKSERIVALRNSLGEYSELNLTELDGRTTTKAELLHHCDVPPFLGDFRLVIVSDLLSRLAGSKTKEGESTQVGSDFVDWLIDYLPTVPDSTVLVLVESKKLSSKHPVSKVVGELGKNKGEVALFSTPSMKGGEFVRWVEDRANAKGAKLERGVAFDLATFIGPDLRLIDSELDKLTAYAADRPITKQDVRLLVPYAQEANVFDMVDALGQRRTEQAFRLLAQLRNEGAHSLYLLTMIVRQYRILLQVQELVGQGLQKDSIASTIGLHPYPAQKAMEQVQRYSPHQLMRIYDRLLETDVAIKTGQMEAELALDLLVVELARA